jgi:hypothetical protein
MGISISIPTALTERASTALRGMTPQAKLVAGSVLTGGAVFSGAVASGKRDSLTAQGIAYAGVLGLLGSIPAYAVGRGALAVATRRAGQALASGAIDEAQAAASILAARSRTLRPAHTMALASGGVAAGVAAGNITFHAAQESVLERMLEQQSSGAQATKQKSS